MAGLVTAAVSARSRLAAASLETLRVGAPHRLHSSSLYLAQEQGYFREAGFDLDIQATQGSQQAFALLAGGRTDVQLGTINVPLLNAIIKGLPIRIVAGRDNVACGNVGVIYGMRKSFPRGLADLTQLKGKRVATARAIGTPQFSLDAQLERAGLSPKDVTAVALENNLIVAALMGGGVDACIGTDEFDHTLAALGPEVVHSGGLAQIYPSFQFGHIMFGQTMLTPDVDRGARFLSAYLRGAHDFAHGKTPRFLEDLAKANRLDQKQTMTGCRDTFPLDGAIDLQSLRLYAAWAARNNYIPRPVEVTELVDDRFLRKSRAS